MKLAEALILRADSQKRLEQVCQRLLRSSKTQEGDQPPEDPEALIEALEKLVSELTSLIQRINRTNSASELELGATLSDALATRDLLKIKHGAYRDLAEAATVKQDRSTRSEIKFQSTVDVAAIQVKADRAAREHREIDTKIQAANWQIDLVD
jgi:N-methylhydantoinase B/oxoprolinase/acetone carboxylase alpha subunit